MIKNYIILLFTSSIIFSCANQTSPTGGPKDENPPILVSSSPENLSTNFNGQRLVLEFDEHIQINNPTQQVIITPRIDQQLEFSNRRNRLIIDFEEPLAENTTYNLNFREGVKDITEGNPVQLNFAFSTGPYLDSLRISGNVFNLIKDKPLVNATVGLQIISDTIRFFEHPPFYFTQTDKNGNFTFNNLKQSEYKIYAFNDRNKDLILQPSGEEHGFLENLILLNRDTSSINIPTININLDSIKIISSRQAGKYFHVNLNKQIADYTAVSKSRPLPNMLGDDNKTIIFFNIDQLADSIRYQIRATDSTSYSLDQIINISYTETQRKPIDLTFSPGEFRIVKSNPEITTSVKFNKPIREIIYDSIYYFHDSTNVFPITGEHITLDSSRSKVNIKRDLPRNLFSQVSDTDNPTVKKGNVASTLYFGQKAFISVESDSTKKFEIKPKLYSDDQLGILLLSINTEYPHFIIELLDSQYKVVRRTSNEKVIRLDRLVPTTYFIRIIVDENNNGTWDPGNIYFNKSPEPIYYYINPDSGIEVPLRANWEVGPLDINIPPVDKDVN